MTFRVPNSGYYHELAPIPIPTTLISILIFPLLLFPFPHIP